MSSVMFQPHDLEDESIAIKKYLLNIASGVTTVIKISATAEASETNKLTFVFIIINFPSVSAYLQ